MGRGALGAIGLALLALAAAPAQGAVPAGSTTLVSHPALGTLPFGSANSSGLHPGREVSADGRYVVFVSQSDGLLAGTSHFHQVYVRDVQGETTTLVSVTPGGQPGNGSSIQPTITADGTRVAFRSEATDLTSDTMPADTTQIYLRDLGAGTTQLVSRASDTTSAGAVANNYATNAEISGNGTAVVFASTATNLAPDDAESSSGVFVRHLDMSPKVTELASRAQNLNGANAPNSSDPAISADGAVVAFVTQSTGLDTTVVDDNGNADVYLRNVDTGDTRLASRADTVDDADPVAGDGASSPALSGNGSAVAFVSSSALSSATDTNTLNDVYVRANAFSGGLAGTTELISRSAPSGPAGNAASMYPQISDDGAAVVFSSDASDLVTGDTNGGGDIFLRTGTTTRLLTRTPAGDVAGFSPLPLGAISADGAFVALASRAIDLSAVDDDDFDDVFRVPAGGGPAVHVSRPTGAAVTAFADGVNSSLLSSTGAIDDAGRRVVFSSYSDVLSTEDDNRFLNVFVADLGTGALTLVSRASGASGAPADNESSGGAFISGDGRRVAFATSAALDPADDNGASDVYVRDLVDHTTRLVSRAAGAGGAVGDQASYVGGIDADGTRVGFSTFSTNLESGDDSATDGYVRDLDAHTTTLVTRADGASGASPSQSAQIVDLDASGNRAVISSQATMDPADADVLGDVYVRDIAAGTTTFVSQSGPDGPGPTANFAGSSISNDGTRVAFGSFSSGGGVFVRDLSAGTTALVSRADGPSGAPATGIADMAAISGDGNRVAFGARQGDLTGEAPTSEEEIYVRDVAAGKTILVSRRDGAAGAPQTASVALVNISLSADGRCVAFSSADSLAGSSHSRDFQHIYLRAIDGECGVVPPDSGGGGGTSGGGATGTGGDQTPSDTTAPVVTRFRVTPRTLRSGRRSSLRFRLSEDASVSIALQRCKQRKRDRCTRYAKAGTIKRAGLKAGARRLRFKGGKPGRYRASIRATDAAGNRSAVRRTPFRVLKRKR